MSPEVSILLPVGPVVEHLDEAITSLERQTLTDFEVCLVLDGVDTSSAVRVRARVAADARFRVLENDGRGLVDALRTASCAARARLFARFDADDVAHPERLARQVEFLERNWDIAVCATRWHVLSDGDPGGGYERYRAWQESLRDPQAIARERFFESPIAHPTVCMQRDVFETLGGYRERGWPEDYDLWLRALELGPCIAILEEDLHGWRDHPERHSRTHSRYARDAFLRCKAHFLVRLPLPIEGVWIWGAGPIGTRLGRFLRAEGQAIEGFIDIDPRKIGSTRGGLPIVSAEHGLALSPSLILAAVGGEGSRLLRRTLERNGLVAGTDFLTVA